MAAQSCGAHNGRAAPMRWFVHSGARSCGMHRLLQAFGLRTTMIGTRYRSAAPGPSDGLRQLGRIVGQWIFRVLQIRLQIIRGSAREAFDVWILDDRLVELRERDIYQRKYPTIVHTGVAARRRGRAARRDRSVKGHVVLLVRVHGEVVGRTDGAEVLVW